MAEDRTPMEDVLRRAFDANLRYWETVNRAASEYVQTMTRVWRDAPVSWVPGTSRPARSKPAEPASPEPRVTPALLLEGLQGEEARAVVMVRNDLDREAEAPVVPSAFTGPDGAALELEVRPEPDRVRLKPGEQVAVILAVDIPADLAEDVGYRGEVNVPGLSERGVPVVVRRRKASGAHRTAGRTAKKTTTGTRAASGTKKTTARKTSGRKADSSKKKS